MAVAVLLRWRRVGLRPCRGRRLYRGLRLAERWDLRGRALDQLIQLAAVQPHAAALGAVVDLHALAFGHGQVYVADGAVHPVTSVRPLPYFTRSGARVSPRIAGT